MMNDATLVEQCHASALVHLANIHLASWLIKKKKKKKECQRILKQTFVGIAQSMINT